MSKRGKYRLLTVVGVVLLFTAVLALSATQMGVLYSTSGRETLLPIDDLSAIPQSVVDDATKSARELFGDAQAQGQEFVDQLLGVYVEAKDKNLVMLFNPGGWGSNLADASPGWWSILNGVEASLDTSGYSSLLLTYQRTVNTVRGNLNEAVELFTGYSNKAEELAYSVEFLTRNIPDLKVIIAGESNGTVIADQAMSMLANNRQVYSIQTGPPPWHRNVARERTLVMTSNGKSPDSFSEGDFGAILVASVKAMLGLSQLQSEPGTILQYVKAPGHDYSWQYPEVSFRINNFLEKTLGLKLTVRELR